MTRWTSSGPTTIVSTAWSMLAGLTWSQVITVTGEDVASLSVPLRDGYETFGARQNVFTREKATLLL